ncbi:MAG: hypothetical protein KC417_14865 [Myxococcales bacterium]|nr:hypothetical protein [Myxococcales bacterium]
MGGVRVRFLLPATLLLGACSGWDWHVPGYTAGDGAMDAGADASDGALACSGSPVTVPIATNGDDGNYTIAAPKSNWWQNFPSGGLNGTADDEVGIYAGLDAYVSKVAYFRFVLPFALESEADVESAHLELWGLGEDGMQIGEPSKRRIDIYLEDTADAAPVDVSDLNYEEDDADVPAVGYIPGPRTVLSNPVIWAFPDPDDWRFPALNRTADIALLLRALIAARGPLAAGAHVQFWFNYSALDPSANTPEVDAQGMLIRIADLTNPTGQPAQLVLCAR